MKGGEGDSNGMGGGVHSRPFLRARGACAMAEARPWLTRFIEKYMMEDPAERQAKLEAHMIDTHAKAVAL